MSDIHEMRPDEYREKHGPTKCEASFEAYSSQNKQNGDWIRRANESGEDLSGYKQKMGEAVSQAIMADPEERARRARLLGALNQTESFRQKSSETAKRTSTRPEILARRSEQLKRWRDTHFDEFYEKCVMKYLNAWHSAPEEALVQLLIGVEGYRFKRSQRIRSETFPTKSKFRQVDAGDKRLRVYVEYDGPLHFQKKFDNQDLEEIQLKDRLLDEHIERHEWTLIRVSFDQWDGKKFRDGCLKQLFEELREPKAGVVRIGEAYAKG